MSGPSFSHDLRQRQTQSLVLAPQLRQSLKILQVAALDLRSVIQEELQANPTLEELPMDGESVDKPSDAEGDETAGESSPNESDDGNASAPEDSSVREEMDFTKQFEILGKLDEDWRDHMANAGGAQSYSAEDAEKRQHFVVERHLVATHRTPVRGIKRDHGGLAAKLRERHCFARLIGEREIRRGRAGLEQWRHCRLHSVVTIRPDARGMRNRHQRAMELLYVTCCHRS